jgi:hypothetical protein
MPELTVADRLVIAAASLDENGEVEFTAEDLVVAAWRAFPDTFGLKGHLDTENQPVYPDSNRVFAEIMGTKPVRARGWLLKVGNKKYKLTEAGRQRVEEVTGRTSTRRVTLDRSSVEEVRRLLNSRAVGKFTSGRSEDITFLDASALWGISARSSANDLSSRLGHFDGLLGLMADLVGDERRALAHGSVVVGRSDVEMLRQLSRELQDRYSTELDVLRRRSER